MRDLQYKPFSMRLAEKTVEELKKVKHNLNISYNLLINNMIHLQKKSNKPINTHHRHQKPEDANHKNPYD